MAGRCSRITSYNVCYTKLLRLLPGPVKALDRGPVVGPLDPGVSGAELELCDLGLFLDQFDGFRQS